MPAVKAFSKKRRQRSERSQKLNGYDLSFSTLIVLVRLSLVTASRIGHGIMCNH
jgi:hypothetical protein